MYKFLSAVLVLAVIAIAQPGEGGYVTKSTDGSFSQWSTDQSLNSMADWYTGTSTDSSACGSVSAKYGIHYRMKQLRNLSSTTQYIKVIYLNTPNDTDLIVLDAKQSSGKRPAIKKVISGMVADSTGLDFQYK
jgi:hypothetical protein